MVVRAPALRRVALAAAVLLLTCVLVVRFAAEPGSAASGWLEPQTLSAPGEHSQNAEVALDAGGNAVAAWTRVSGHDRLVQVTARPAGGTWQPPVTLDAGGVLPYVHVGVDPRGNAVVLWEAFAARRYVVMSATQPAGGAWSRAVRVSRGSVRMSLPWLAVDPRGNAFAVWEEWRRGLAIVRAAVRPHGGSWRRPTVLARIPGASSEDFAGAVIAAGGNGDVIATWTRASKRRAGRRPLSTSVQAAVRTKGARWQRPTALSNAGTTATASRAALDPRGNAMAIWLEATRADSPTSTLRAAARPVGGRWGVPVRLSATGEHPASGAQVAIDSRGTAIALWSNFAKQELQVVRSSVRPAGRGWQAPVDVSAPGEHASAGALALDAGGNAYAAWDRSLTFHEDTDLYDGVVRVARRPAGGTWEAPADISPVGTLHGDVQLASGPAGPAIAIWEELGGRDIVVRVAIRPG